MSGTVALISVTKHVDQIQWYKLARLSHRFWERRGLLGRAFSLRPRRPKFRLMCHFVLSPSSELRPTQKFNGTNLQGSRIGFGRGVAY